MPLYGSQIATNSPLPCLMQSGDSVLLFNAESPLTGQLSLAVAIAQAQGSGAQKAVSVEITFSGNPGTFQFNVQDSDTDAQDNYLNVPSGGQLTTATGPGNAGKYVTKTELVPFAGMFIALKCTTQNQNAVTVTAKVTQQ